MFSKIFFKDKKPLRVDGVYCDGAYRLHKSADIEHFTQLAHAAFPDLSKRVECFGADWLGRQFAHDHGRLRGKEPLVLMLEPGTGEALEIPADYSEFHAHELIEQAEAVAATSFFGQWRSAGGAPPSYDQCVGYRIPLFLGGQDDISNLEIIDFDVYWTMVAQLLTKARQMPVGTTLHHVELSD
jgi:Domain of unknown function (DUF1851)